MCIWDTINLHIQFVVDCCRRRRRRRHSAISLDSPLPPLFSVANDFAEQAIYAVEAELATGEKMR